MKHLTTTLTAAAFVAGGISVASAQTTLKVGLIDPPGHIDVQATERMAERVAEATDGEVILEVYPAAQLGFANDMLSGMKLGSVEMFVGATTWLGTFDRDFWISGTPYIFNSQEHAREVHQGDAFGEMADKLVDEQGIRILTMNWDRGPRNFIATTPVETIEDLEGLKIRVPPQEAWIANFELAGASPTPMPLTETFTGLQQGIVEATEQASNWLYANKYHTIAENLTRTAHNYEETGVMISEQVWQGLSDDQQDAMRSAATEVAEWHNEQVAMQIDEAEQTMMDEGVNIIDVDIDAWEAQFRENFGAVVDEIGYSQDLADAISAQWD